MLFNPGNPCCGFINVPSCISTIPTSFCFSAQFNVLFFEEYLAPNNTVTDDPPFTLNFNLTYIEQDRAYYIAYGYYCGNWIAFVMRITCGLAGTIDGISTYNYLVAMYNAHSPFEYPTYGYWELDFEGAWKNYHLSNIDMFYFSMLNSWDYLFDARRVGGTVGFGRGAFVSDPPGAFSLAGCAENIGAVDQQCHGNAVNGSQATFSVEPAPVWGTISYESGIYDGIVRAWCGWLVCSVRDTAYDETFIFMCYKGRCVLKRSIFADQNDYPDSVVIDDTGIVAVFKDIFLQMDLSFPVFGDVTVTIPAVPHPPQTPPGPRTGSCGGALTGKTGTFTSTGLVFPGTYIGTWSTLPSGQDILLLNIGGYRTVIYWYTPLDSQQPVSEMYGVVSANGYNYVTIGTNLSCGPPMTASYDDGHGFSGVLVTT